MALLHPPTRARTTPTGASPSSPPTTSAGLPQRWRVVVPGLVMLLTLALIAALAAAPFTPASVVPADASPTIFSAERALPHLQAIAQSPHPVGSPENARGRDYLMTHLRGMGLQPELQPSVGFRPENGSIASIENVLVRLPGAANSQAVLIVAHYDSVMGAPGAGDNGVAVAAMLETVRAIRAGSPLRNDLIFLFDDGEEPGLFGASAFVEGHPWARDVGVAFDFDADGPIGTTILLWTTPNDGWLVSEIARAVPTVMAISSGNSARRLRQNNDLHALQAAGLTGAHFNTVAGSTVYHSSRDSLASLDMRSLQDRGNVMLAVARHFGDLPIGTTTASDTTFFTLFGRAIVYYPLAWAAPLALLTGLSVGVAAAVGLWRRRDWQRLGLGLLVLPLIALVAAVAAHLTWQIILAAHPESRIFGEQDFYGRGVYLYGLFTLTVALGLVIWPWLDRHLGATNLAAGALGWLAVVVIFQAITSPETSLPATWVALVMAPALTVLSLVPAQPANGLGRRSVRGAALLLAAVAALGALVPLLVAVSLDGLEAGPALPIAFLVLLLGLLAPHLALIAQLGRRWLPATAAFVGLGLLLIASLAFGTDANRPRHESLVYFSNPEAGQAYWATLDPALGSWTSQLLGNDAMRRSMVELVGTGGDEQLLSSRAPVAPLPAPDLVVISRERQGDEWILRLHLASPRGASRAFLVPASGTRLLAAAVDGQRLQPLGNQQLMISGLPATGLDLTVRLQASGPARLILIDQTAGLPVLVSVSLPARPATTMALPGPEWAQGDPTLVLRSITLTP